MTYKGHVKNGVVVLDEPAALPEGAEVEVLPVSGKERKSTLGERLLECAGTIEGPPDLSINHDHYLHGAPKIKP